MESISADRMKLFVECVLWDAALSDPMGADLLLWIWRMIYVTHNNNIFPNIQKNDAVSSLHSRVDQHLVGSADRQTLKFDLNPFNAKHKNWSWFEFVLCLCSSCCCREIGWCVCVLRLVVCFHKPIPELVDFHLFSSLATFLLVNKLSVLWVLFPKTQHLLCVFLRLFLEAP